MIVGFVISPRLKMLDDLRELFSQFTEVTLGQLATSTYDNFGRFMATNHEDRTCQDRIMPEPSMPSFMVSQRTRKGQNDMDKYNQERPCSTKHRTFYGMEMSTEQRIMETDSGNSNAPPSGIIIITRC